MDSSPGGVSGWIRDFLDRVWNLDFPGTSANVLFLLLANSNVPCHRQSLMVMLGWRSIKSLLFSSVFSG